MSPEAFFFFFFFFFFFSGDHTYRCGKKEKVLFCFVLFCFVSYPISFYFKITYLLA